MNWLVDTSVWSLAFRRDGVMGSPFVDTLHAALTRHRVCITGLILQEFLQGVTGPKQRKQLLAMFAAFHMIEPNKDDYVAAAELRNQCRRKGVRLGTIDALIAQLCIHHELPLLTTDKDFTLAAKHCPLRVWAPPKPS